jgi:glycosyltransferase involved in cell wall biosynthesis
VSDAEPGGLDVSVVVPFFNPGTALAPTLEGLAAALGADGWTFEIIAVSDGSTDPPPQAIADLGVAHLRVEALDPNRGKGAALRAGMQLGTGRYVGFIDADGDIPPSAMVELVRVAVSEDPDAVLGSKQGSAKEGTRWSRRVGSVAWRWLARALFGLSVDSQTGVKLFRADVLGDALPRTSLDGFAFDLELIVAARGLGHTDLREVPVPVNRQGSSTVSMSTASRMLGDLATIFWRTRLRRRYVPAVPAPTRTVSPSGPTHDSGGALPSRAAGSAPGIE